MTHDEAMKLVGGYATNSLTEEQRKGLLAAALDDQELFDALEREQGLKDVFDDRVARAEVRQALETPESGTRASWTRWWAWGGASAAVAALVAIFSTVQHRPEPVQVSPVEKSMTQHMTQAEDSAPPELKRVAPAAVGRQVPVKGKPEPALAVAKDDRERREDKSLAKEMAAAAPGRQQPMQTAPGSANSVLGGSISARDAMLSQARMEAVPADRGMLASRKAITTLLNYTLLKREADGREVAVLPGDVHEADVIRISVSPAVGGTLSVYLLRNGVSALATPLLSVSAQRSYVVPDTAITVKAGDVLQLELPGGGVTIPLGKQ